MIDNILSLSYQIVSMGAFIVASIYYFIYQDINKSIYWMLFAILDSMQSYMVIH
jgi:hypothetical protein